MINVTKTYLPPFEEYTAVLKRAWDKGWIANKGELVKELEEKLKAYLGVKHLLFCTSGTVALQIALKALKVKGEIITTPYSYVATTGVILWENCTPVFVDIDKNSFCINASKIEEFITDKTTAILATHVYGQPCNIDAIKKIADKYKLKVIYDGAHAFGTNYKGKSIFEYGDISTCSFHATKLFHTAEGGCIITDNDELAETIRLYHQFGHVKDDYYSIGINGKNSELHAAMGLCNFNYIDSIVKKRREQWLHYYSLLKDNDFELLHVNDANEFNYSYFPVVFKTEELLVETIALLNQYEIMPRRYFYPSLNKLPYLTSGSCPVSERISSAVICLPLYDDLEEFDIERISKIILRNY